MVKSALRFLSQVKQEFLKITWTPRKQAFSITLVVFVMVFVMAMFFFVLDWILSNLVSFILGLIG